MLLKLIDAKEVMDNLKPEEAKQYVAYFVQYDTWDFHVFRIMKGDYDGNQDIYTLEMDNISKSDIINELNIELGGLDIRQAFDYIDELDAIKTVVEFDVNRGFENWDFKTADSLEEALELITENGFYTPEEMLYEDTSKEEKYSGSELHLHYSLEEAMDLVDKLLQDPRANRYQGVELRAYQNGREQGYLLQYTDKDTGEEKAITFAQQRNSDALIVYHGPTSEKTVSEIAYQNSNSFRYRHFNAAKNYIFELLDAHAPLSEDENPIAIHPGLAIANIILAILLADERKSTICAAVEGLQEADFNGYSIINYRTPNKNNTLNITSTANSEIALFIGKSTFNGIDEQAVMEWYANDELQQVVDRIFNYIQENTSKTA